MRAKYIILHHTVPFIFAASEEHATVARALRQEGSVTSAGFVQVTPDAEDPACVTVKAYGKSESLQMGPDDSDSHVLTQMFKTY